MKKLKRTLFIAAAMAAILLAISVPAALSFYGLGKVQEAVAAIQRRNERAATTRVLLDQYSDIQSRFLGLLLNIDPQEREEIHKRAQAMVQFDSALDRVMTVSADFLSPEKQVELWEAGADVAKSWEEITNMNLATLSDDERRFYFQKIVSGIRKIRFLVDQIDANLARNNKSYISASVERVASASLMLILIMIGGLIIGVTGAGFMFVMIRNMRTAEREVRESQAKVAAQNQVFKSALDNMRHGLSMYDADYRLDVINQRFLEIYGFREDEIWPGISIEELKKVRTTRGFKIYSEAGEPIVDVFKTTRSANGEVPQSDVELERDVVMNGRIIRVTRTPRVGGGWVVMHADITERRNALKALEVRERELTEQNQRFKDLVEGSPYGMSMFDSDKRLVVCNRRYVELYGLEGIELNTSTSFADVANRIFDNAVYLDHSDAARRKFLGGASAAETSHNVLEFRDGRLIQMLRFPRPGGGWVAVHEDVTERLTIEREFQANKTELAIQNERFSDALENMGQGLSMYDQDNKLLVCNRLFLDYYGFPPGFIKIGMPLSEIAAWLLEGVIEGPATNHYVAKYYAPVAERESFVRLRPQKNGRIVEVSSYLRPEGGWVVIHNDVTDREQARRELEHSESAQRQQSELFKDALDNMGHGINVFDGEGRLLVYNKQFLDMTGLTEADIPLGTQSRDIIGIRNAKGLFTETLEEFLAEHSDSLRNKEYFEHVQTSVHGAVITLAFFPRAGGGWVVLHRDVTEIVHAENEARQAAQEAEQLRQQEQAAVASNQAKSAFLAMMSHEIRTPMNAVIGLSSALLGSDLDSEQHRIVDTIHESSNSLLRLLNDILDFSKLDAGRVEFEAAAFSPAALISHAVSIVDGKALDKGLAVRTTIGADMPAALLGDETRLRQVVLNLLTNAIKFTDHGFVEIHTHCVARLRNHVTIECRVSDTGIGIAPEHMDRLFSEFSQADPSINRRFGGTGLGLAISKRIVEQMGGDIQVESTVGIGTTFIVTLTLPVTDEAALAEPNARANSDEFVSLLARAPRPLQILLAEDNPTNQLVFTKLMQPFHVEITLTDNGRLALEQASQRVFDVVFMDMRMPEMDGLEATRAIRALGGEWARIPVIALTANAFADDMKACRDAGMDEFVSKPIRRKTLVETLAKVLEGHPVFGADSGFVAPAKEAAIASLPVTPPAEVSLTDVAPILDRKAFDMLVDEIDADGVAMTLDVFLGETVTRLALLERLSCENERQRIRDEAHTLKGASATFGLCQVAELSKMLEHAAPSMTAEGHKDLVARLKASFAVARTEVEAAMKQALARQAAHQR